MRPVCFSHAPSCVAPGGHGDVNAGGRSPLDHADAAGRTSGDNVRKYFVHALADRPKFVYWGAIMAATLSLMRDLSAPAAGNICPGLSTGFARSLSTRFG